MGKTIRRSFIRTWMGEGTAVGMYVRSSKTRIIFVSMSGWHQNGWKETEYGSHVEEIDEKMWILTNPHHFLTMKTWDVLSANANRLNETILKLFNKMCESRISAGATEKLPGWKNLTRKLSRCPTTWRDMLKNASSGNVNWQTRKWSNFTQFQILAWMIINSRRRNMNLRENCLKYANKLYWKWLKNCQKYCHLARIGRPDILWSVKKLARSVTKWSQACDRRLARLSSYVGNTAQHCRLGLFQDSDFAVDLEDSKSTSENLV